MTLAPVSAVDPALIVGTYIFTDPNATSVGSGGSEMPGRASVPVGRSAAARMIVTPSTVTWSAVASIVMPPVACS